MTPPRADDPEPVWEARFRADLAEDTRSERRLLVRSLVIGAVVVAGALARWLLV